MKKTRDELSPEEIKVYRYKRKRPNGDIYIYEQESYYDTDAGFNRTLGSKLVAKILAGTNEEVPTREKRRNVNRATAAKQEKQVENNNTVQIQGAVIHVGMMDIINHICKEYGIDQDVEDSTDKPTAQKILSVAQYLVGNMSNSLAAIEEFQYTHLLPYEDGINRKIYHKLFQEIGPDETLRQSFFLARIAREDDAILYVAYDSTTEASESKWLKSARYGMNKAQDGRKTIKYVIMYSLKSGMPLCYFKQQGNIPDVVTLTRLREQLAALGIHRYLLVADNGYCSEANIDSLLLSGNEVLTRIETDTSWVHKYLEKYYKKLISVSSSLSFDHKMHGIRISVPRMVDTGEIDENGKPVSKQFNISLLLFYNGDLRSEEDAMLSATLHRIKAELMTGKKVDAFSRGDKSLINQCLHVKEKNGKIKVDFIQKGIDQVSKEHGTFALIASMHDDPEEGLIQYRKRGEIEDEFRLDKEDLLGEKTGCSSDEVLDGKLFTRFVALCIEEGLSNKIHDMKKVLGKPNNDKEHDTKKNLDAEKKLLSWLNERSIKRILAWFDTNDRIIVSKKLEVKKWNTEVLSRDRLFLTKLGITA